MLDFLERLLLGPRPQPYPRSRKHPTPEQAYEALSEGLCLYAPVSKCSGPPRQVGLRSRDDVNVVLACKSHIGALWALDERRARELEWHLHGALARRNRKGVVNAGLAADGRGSTEDAASAGTSRNRAWRPRGGEATR